jgi:hypothetical protein
MSRLNLKRKLLTLLSHHSRLFKQILRHRAFLRGSFHQVYTHCGKANCWCAKANKGHAHARLTWSEQGTMMTRKVGAAERPAVTKLTARYKQFCEQRRQLTDLEAQIQNHLDEHAAALIRQGQKVLGLSISKSPKTTKTQSTMQTRRTRQN